MSTRGKFGTLLALAAALCGTPAGAQEAAANSPRVPIVALTADALETGKRACQEAGMDGFLTKPVDPAELEEMFLMLFPSEDGPLIVAA